MKKGQVTIFIILGLLILISVAIYISFKSTTSEEMVKGEIETKTIKSYIESVLEESTEQTIKTIVKQGGEFTPEDYKESQIEGETVRIAYGIKGEDVVFNQNLEEEICEGVVTFFRQNIDLDFIEKRGIKYEDGPIECNTKITYNEVETKLNYPINLSKNVSKTKIEEFYASIDVEFGRLMHNVTKLAEVITKRDELTLSELDISCDRMRACNEGKIMEVMLYYPWRNNPGLRLYFAMDEELEEEGCTKLEKINDNNC